MIEPLLPPSDELGTRWQQFALCQEVDPEAFFPERGGSIKDAKATCARCDVRTQCREWAIVNNMQIGVWGGLSERERAKIVRQRKRAS